MKKPWVIGLLSIFPGLGFFVLGKIRQSFIAAIITVGFIIFSLLTTAWENLSATALALGLAAWVSQLIFAVLVAQSETRSETLPRREVSIAPPSQDASLKEKHQYKVRKTILELLGPGENLKIALEGTIKSLPFLQALIYSLIWAPPTVTSVYLGITDEHLIKVLLDNFPHKPAELHRIPLSQVVGARSREGLLSDRIDIQVGESTPLSIEVTRSSRDSTRQLIRFLTGKPYANLSASTQIHDIGPFTSLRKNIKTKHPILVSALLGAYGGIVGTVIAALILFLLSLGIIFTDSTDSGEGWGYLIGLYCLFMFPIGAGILGGIPGVIVGIYLRFQGRDMTMLPPVLAGFLSVLVLTLGGISAIFLIPYP